MLPTHRGSSLSFWVPHAAVARDATTFGIRSPFVGAEIFMRCFPADAQAALHREALNNGTRGLAQIDARVGSGDVSLYSNA